MKMLLRNKFTLMPLVLLAFAVNANAWEPDTKLPPLDEFSLEGEVVPLEGKVTLVDFWASWCAPCKAAFPEMEKLYQEYKDAGFQILAVSVDQNAKQMDRFLAKQKPSFSIAHDAKELMAKSADIQAMPSSYLIDQNGVVRFAHTGWHGKKSVESLTQQIQTLLNE